MTIFVTGDIHGGHDIHKFNTMNLRVKGMIKENDFVIVCGDFGLVFDQNESKEEKYWLKWLDQKPWITLFVDGNHENFDRLNSLPKQERWGGRVQQISKKVFHLLRGEIYQIEDQTIFAFGGAFSHDRQDRKEHISWWQEELPNQEECHRAMENLKMYRNEVDLIITHDAPRHLAEGLGFYRDAMKTNGYQEDRVNILDFLESIYQSVSFRDWFCGHYHLDYDTKNFHFLFQRILESKGKTNAGCIYPEFQLGEKVLFATKENEKPLYKGIIQHCYPYGLGVYRYGYSDYDILCTEDQPFGKNAICQRIHEEWIEKNR